MDLMDGIRSRKRTLEPLITEKRSPREEGEEEMADGVLTEDEQPLSPTARLFHQPHFNCYIIVIMGFGKRIDVDAVKKGLEVTLLKHPRFSSLHVLEERKGGEQKWVRTKVVLENHLVVPDLDPEMESPDKFVEDYAADLTKTSLDMSKPLWEVHILNVKTAEAEANGILRIHHSLGDGISLMSLLLACFRKTADPDSPPSMPEMKKVVSKRSGIFLPFLLSIWSFLWLVWNTVVDASLFFATAVFLKDTDTPLKGDEGVEFRPKRFVHCTVSLDDVKTVKTAVNSTINDVFLGVTAAGLSRYLSRRYGKDKAENIRTRSLPANIRLRATVLVNVRPTPGIHALHDMLEKNKADIKWGNWLGYVILPFITEIQDDPLEYVRKAKAIANRKKNSLESLFTFSSASLIVKTIGIKAAAHLSHRVLSNTTMSLSNVVGPMEEVSFCSHPMVYLAPSVYGHPQALTVHFQSYMNNVKIVLAVDENAVPDPHLLCADLANSLKLMKDAVVARQ